MQYSLNSLFNHPKKMRYLYISPKKTLFDHSNYIDNSVYVMYLITKYNCVYLLVGINLKENY